jgi:hypothetical protein
MLTGASAAHADAHADDLEARNREDLEGSRHPLRVNVRVKEKGDSKGYSHKDKGEQSRRSRPLGPHAEAG